MILYHGINNINCLKPIVHHMVYHPNEKCILVGGFNDKYKCFDNVEHTIMYVPFNCTPFGKGVQLKGKELDDYILKYFDNEFNKRNINLDDISEFYIGSCWSTFPEYLQLKGIKYNFVEEASGDLFPSNNEYVIKRYCLISAVTDDTVDKSTLVNYDVTKEIYKLNEEQRKQIIEFFNVPTNPIKNFDVLLLTQWWFEDGYVKKFTNDDRIYMYGLLLDYYCNNKSVYIKPHPTDDIKSNYLNYFTNCEVETVRYISELMGLIPNIHFKKAITISSTSIATVSSFCDELVDIGVDYKELHYKIIKFDVAVQLSKFLYGFNLNTIRYGIYDRDVEVLPNFFEDIAKGDCSANDQIVISDEFYLKKNYRLDKNRIVQKLDPDQISMKENGSIKKFVVATETTNNCFIITHNFEEIFEKCIRDINNIIVIKISKEKVKQICGADLQNEYIYVYCKNIEIRNKVEEFIFEKHLFQTGIKITAKPMSLSETQLHYENIALKSKQFQLTNQVKTLNDDLNNYKKRIENQKNEINKLNNNQKDEISNLNQKFDKLSNIVNELQKASSKDVQTNENTKIYEKLQTVENSINKKFDVILHSKTRDYNKINGQLRWARGEISNIRNSFSYKLGRALTWLPRQFFKKGE